MPLQRNLDELIKGDIRYNEPLSFHTTFKIGGPCEAWAEPYDTDDLRRLLSFSKETVSKLFVLGAGSNVLFKDSSYDGIVVTLSKPFFKNTEFSDGYVLVGAGVHLAALIGSAKDEGWGGIEALAGIPASVGGALIMNAGNIGDFVEDVYALDYDGNEVHLVRSQINFNYRNSSLENLIVIAAKLKLAKRTRREIEQDIIYHIDKKRSSQDLISPSAGCIFKNPKDGPPAWRLVDLCGLKGLRVGGAEVSGIHANFIINRGDATCKDVLALINCIRYEVERRCGVQLELELKIV